MVGFYCTGGRGTEVFIAKELQNKNYSHVKVEDGKVFFEAERESFVNLISLKSVERVFLKIIHENLTTKKVSKTNSVRDILVKRHLWTDSAVIETIKNITHYHYTNKKDHAVDSQVFASEDQPPTKKLCAQHLRESQNEKEVSFRISFKCSGEVKKRVNCQLLSKQVGSKLKKIFSWKTDLRNPVLEVCGHLNDDSLVVGIPLQREPLSKRSYIKHFGLRSTVSWIMVTLLDIHPGDKILDPLCGKGTILVEGAFNYKFGSFIGIDCDKKQLEYAKENMDNCDMKSRISLVMGNAKRLCLLNDSVDKVVCDAPFGQNHKTDAYILDFYSDVIKEIHRVMRRGGKLLMLTSQELHLKVIELCKNAFQHICDCSCTKNMTSKSEIDKIPCGSCTQSDGFLHGESYYLKLGETHSYLCLFVKR